MIARFDYHRFRDDVEKAMEANGWNKTRLCKDSGVAWATLSRFFDGTVRNVDSIMSLAQVCGLRVETYRIIFRKDQSR